MPRVSVKRYQVKGVKPALYKYGVLVNGKVQKDYTGRFMLFMNRSDADAVATATRNIYKRRKKNLMGTAAKKAAPKKAGKK
jgi:hypothetical protein